jgi:hypothetical protein
MDQWWNSLNSADQVLWGMAAFSTVFFLLQTAMSLMGLGGGEGLGDDLDGDGGDDLGGSGFTYFTVRNMVAFFLGLSWGGLTCRQFNFPLLLAIPAGVAAGVGFVAASFYIMNSLAKLKSDGTISLNNAIGKEANVTLTVPAQRGGKGKVMVEVQGRLIELEAETEGQAILRNKRVYVLEVIDGSTLLIGEI